MFETFKQFLERSGDEAKGGQIIDATLMPVSIQRNSRDGNKQINSPAVSYGVLKIAGSDSLPFMISGRIGPI